MNKFRTSILILAMVFMGTQGLKAQEKGTSAFNIGIGAGSSTEIANDVLDGIGSIFTLGNFRYENESYSPVILLGYKYAVIDRLMVGVNLTYQNAKTDRIVSTDAKPVFGDLEGEITDNFYTIGIEGVYHYISKPSFQMYSGLGIGYTMNTEKFVSNADSASDRTDTYGLVPLQFTFAGFRFGKTIAASLELGFGYKGVLNAGLSYQFQKKE